MVKTWDEASLLHMKPKTELRYLEPLYTRHLCVCVYTSFTGVPM